MNWCLGFIFSPSLREVLLIKKGQKLHVGKWNGLGGSLEPGENFLSAMVRECKEESGLDISREKWLSVGNLVGKNWNVEVFAAQCEWGTGLQFDRVLDYRTVYDQEHDQPLFMSFTFLTLAEMAPHTGALIYSSLDKLRNPDLPSIRLEER